MKTTTKFALSLIVGVMAIVFSAFKTAEDHKTTTASVFYILTSVNQYTRVTGQPAESGCAEQADHRCVIGFDENQGTTLDANDLPSEPTYESGTNGLWNTPQ